MGKYWPEPEVIVYEDRAWVTKMRGIYIYIYIYIVISLYQALQGDNLVLSTLLLGDYPCFELFYLFIYLFIYIYIYIYIY